MRYLFTILLSFSLIGAFGQNRNWNDDDENRNDLSELSTRERMYVGGDLGLNLGTTFSLINVSPIMGYRLTRPFSVGLGLKYQWLRYDDGYTEYSDHTWGGSIFAKYLIGRALLAHAEFEALNVRNVSYFQQGDRAWPNMCFVGGGYRQGTDTDYFQFLILYDLIDDRNSPYRFQYIIPGLPIIIRGGIVISLG